MVNISEIEKFYQIKIRIYHLQQHQYYWNVQTKINQTKYLLKYMNKLLKCLMIVKRFNQKYHQTLSKQTKQTLIGQQYLIEIYRFTGSSIQIMQYQIKVLIIYINFYDCFFRNHFRILQIISRYQDRFLNIKINILFNSIIYHSQTSWILYFYQLGVLCNDRNIKQNKIGNFLVKLLKQTISNQTTLKTFWINFIDIQAQESKKSKTNLQTCLSGRKQQMKITSKQMIQISIICLIKKDAYINQELNVRTKKLYSVLIIKMINKQITFQLPYLIQILYNSNVYLLIIFLFIVALYRKSRQMINEIFMIVFCKDHLHSIQDQQYILLIQCIEQKHYKCIEFIIQNNNIKLKI